MSTGNNTVKTAEQIELENAASESLDLIKRLAESSPMLWLQGSWYDPDNIHGIKDRLEKALNKVK
jgi:hypothetical protein